MAIATTLPWSPDGRTIAFTYHPCPDCDEVLAFMNPDGKHSRQLNFKYQNASAPVLEHAWSPDGKRIVFGTQQTLWVVDLGRSTFRRVAYNGDNHSPAWQPLPRKG